MLDKIQQKPHFCVLKNKLTQNIKQFLIHESINYQFVPIKEHRVNTIEKAIKTIKSHHKWFILNRPKFPYTTMGPTTTSKWRFPQHGKVCNDPSKSAYYIIHGNHNFSDEPWAPLGYKEIVYKHLQSHTLWEGTNAWYNSPAKDHYQYYCNDIIYRKTHWIKKVSYSSHYSVIFLKSSHGSILQKFLKN